MMMDDRSVDAMVQKSKQKQRIERYHQSNIGTESIPANDYHLQRTGLRGEKVIILNTFLVFLLVLCVVNLVILSLMISTFGISINGMAGLAFMKAEDTGQKEMVKFLTDTEVDHLYLDQGSFVGYQDAGLNIQAQAGQEVTFGINDGTAGAHLSSISLGPAGTQIRTPSFKFVDPTSKKRILDIDGRTKLSLIGDINGKSLKTNALLTSMITSPVDSDLSFESLDGHCNLTGNEGLYIDGKDILGLAQQNIHIKTKDVRSALVMQGVRGGVRLERSKLTDTSASPSRTNGVIRHRLCGCDNGKLFMVQVKPELTQATCNTIDQADMCT